MAVAALLVSLLVLACGGSEGGRREVVCPPADERPDRQFDATFESADSKDDGDGPPDPYGFILEQGRGDEATTTVVPAPGKDGSALKMVMPPSRGAEADEPNRLQLHPSPEMSWRTGDDVYYGISIYIDEDWDLSQVDANRQQFQTMFSMRWGGDLGQQENGPGGGFNLKKVEGDSVPHFLASREDDGFDYPDDGGTDEIDLGPVVKAEWIDFVVHIKWSDEASGGVREYWRDGVLMGRSTNQNLGTDGPVIHRMGMYQGTAVDHTRTLYWDNHRIGSSYEAVDPACA